MRDNSQAFFVPVNPKGFRKPPELSEDSLKLTADVSELPEKGINHLATPPELPDKGTNHLATLPELPERKTNRLELLPELPDAANFFVKPYLNKTTIYF